MPGVKERFYEYCTETYLVGPKYLLPENAPWRRVMWAVALFIAFGMTSYQLSLQFYDLMHNWMGVNITRANAPSVPFPKVIFCNTMPYRISQIDDELVKAFDNIFRQQPWNTSDEGLTMLQRIAMSPNADPLLRNSKKFFKKVAPQKENFIVQCQFNNIDCMKDLEMVFTDEGVCYAFNNNKELTVKEAGIHVLLNIEDYESMSGPYSTIGAKVTIVPQESEAIVRQYGLYVLPGKSTKISLLLRETDFMDGYTCNAFQELNLYHVERDARNISQRYTLDKCILDQRYQNIRDECKCIPAMSPEEPTAALGICSVEQHISCVLQRLGKPMLNAVCTTHCDVLTYRAHGSRATLDWERVRDLILGRNASYWQSLTKDDRIGKLKEKSVRNLHDPRMELEKRFTNVNNFFASVSNHSKYMGNYTCHERPAALTMLKELQDFRMNYSKEQLDGLEASLRMLTEDVPKVADETLAVGADCIASQFDTTVCARMDKSIEQLMVRVSKHIEAQRNLSQNGKALVQNFYTAFTNDGSWVFGNDSRIAQMEEQLNALDGCIYESSTYQQAFEITYPFTESTVDVPNYYLLHCLVLTFMHLSNRTVNRMQTFSDIDRRFIDWIDMTYFTAFQVIRKLGEKKYLFDWPANLLVNPCQFAICGALFGAVMEGNWLGWADVEMGEYEYDESTNETYLSDKACMVPYISKSYRVNCGTAKPQPSFCKVNTWISSYDRWKDIMKANLGKCNDKLNVIHDIMISLMDNFTTNIQDQFTNARVSASVLREQFDIVYPKFGTKIWPVPESLERLQEYIEAYRSETLSFQNLSLILSGDYNGFGAKFQANVQTNLRDIDDARERLRLLRTAIEELQQYEPYDQPYFGLIEDTMLWQRGNTQKNMNLLLKCIANAEATISKPLDDEFESDVVQDLVDHAEQFVDTLNLRETFYMNNIAAVSVYLEDLTKELVVQQPAYDAWKFLADVGGTMGLYLGACLLTILEFIHFLIYCDEPRRGDD